MSRRCDHCNKPLDYFDEPGYLCKYCEGLPGPLPPFKRPSNMLGAITTWLIILTIIFMLGGCMIIDYRVYQTKYPTTGVREYLWNKVFK